MKRLLFLPLCLLILSTQVLAQTFQVSSSEEFRHTFIRAISDRLSEFTVEFTYPTDVNDEFNALWGNLQCLDPYDYFHITQINYNYYPNGSQMTYDIQYRTTREQEAELTQALRSIVGNWQGLSPLDKVRAVHDWVVTNLAYDTTLGNYSAYEAFFSGRAVCEGYSLLTYKMLFMLDIENILVTGYSEGQDHMWNLVKLCCGECCSWFHLDTTWDDPIPDGMLRHDYFLLSDAEIQRDHYIANSCNIYAPKTLSEWQAWCETPECEGGVEPRCNVNEDCLTEQYCRKDGCGGEGVCVEKPEVCPQVYQPVCGCDGRTYGNECEAAQAGVNVAYEGECETTPPDQDEVSFDCCTPCEDQCGTDLSCTIQCEVWQQDYCPGDGCQGGGEEASCPLRHLPTSQNLVLTAQNGGPDDPLRVTSALRVCFRYSSPAYLLVGVFDENFERVWWLEDCRFTEIPSLPGPSPTLFCPQVSLPIESGYLFWVASPVDFLELDWDNGPYEIGVTQFVYTAGPQTTIAGQLVTCSTDCAATFPGDISNVIQCNVWQQDNCE